MVSLRNPFLTRHLMMPQPHKEYPMPSMESRVAVLEAAERRRSDLDLEDSKKSEQLNVSLQLTMQSVNTLREEIQVIRNAGWKVLVIVGGIGAAIFQFFGWCIDHLRALFPHT